MRSAVFCDITQRHVVTSQKSADLINIAAEAWNLGDTIFEDTSMYIKYPEINVTRKYWSIHGKSVFGT
jgi:hypothetical protein